MFVMELLSTLLDWKADGHNQIFLIGRYSKEYYNDLDPVMLVYFII